MAVQTTATAYRASLLALITILGFRYHSEISPRAESFAYVLLPQHHRWTMGFATAPVLDILLKDRRIAVDLTERIISTCQCLLRSEIRVEVYVGRDTVYLQVKGTNRFRESY